MYCKLSGTFLGFILLTTLAPISGWSMSARSVPPPPPPKPASTLGKPMPISCNPQTVYPNTNGCIRSKVSNCTFVAPFGQSCSSYAISKSCAEFADSLKSGNYVDNCKVGEPKPCTFSYNTPDRTQQNININHSGSITAYKLSTAPTCAPQTISCYDGSLYFGALPSTGAPASSFSANNASGNYYETCESTIVSPNMMSAKFSLSYGALYGRAVYEGLNALKQQAALAGDAQYQPLNDYPAGTMQNGSDDKILVQGLDVKAVLGYFGINSIDYFLSRKQFAPLQNPAPTLLDNKNLDPSFQYDGYLAQNNVLVSTETLGNETFFNSCVAFPGLKLFGKTHQTVKNFTIPAQPGVACWSIAPQYFFGIKIFDGHTFCAMDPTPEGTLQSTFTFTPPEINMSGAKVCIMSKLSQDPANSSVPKVNVLYVSDLEMNTTIVPPQVSLSENCIAGNCSRIPLLSDPIIYRAAVTGLNQGGMFGTAIVQALGMVFFSNPKNGSDSLTNTLVNAFLGNSNKLTSWIYTNILKSPASYTISSINDQINKSFQNSVTLGLNGVKQACINSINNIGGAITSLEAQQLLSYCDNPSSWLGNFGLTAADSQTTALGCNDSTKFMKLNTYKAASWGKYAGEPWLANYIPAGAPVNPIMASLLTNQVGCRHTIKLQAQVPHNLQPFIACNIAGASAAFNDPNFKLGQLHCESLIPNLNSCLSDPNSCVSVLNHLLE